MQVSEVYILGNSDNNEAPLVSNHIRNVLIQVQLFSRSVDESRQRYTIICCFDARSSESTIGTKQEISE